MFIPGRIEILGKHTDYCGGRSIVCATDRGFVADVESRRDSVLRIVNCDHGEIVSFDLYDPRVQAGHWANYAAEVARRVSSNFRSQALRGLNLRFSSNLPKAAGLSSSSALMILVFAAIDTANQLRAFEEYRENIRSDLDLAEYLGCIENGQTFRGLAGSAGIGTFGGSQDHAAIMLCKQGELSSFSFIPLTRESELSIPDGFSFIVATSGVVAEKSGNAKQRFNRLSLMVSEVVKTVDGGSLAELTERLGPEEVRRRILSAASKFSPDELVRRFDQFYTENYEIIPAFSAALMDQNFKDLGEIVDRSQHNAERLLGNQVDETIFLQRSAREIGASAASAFGAGFGGSVYALVKTPEAETLMTEWRRVYREAFPMHEGTSDFFVTRPSAIVL